MLAVAAFAADEPQLLLDERYPIVVSESKPAALLHWLDGLAGLTGLGFTAGKTVDVQRQEFLQRFGELDLADSRHLQAFREVRRRFAERPGPGGADELTLKIFAAATMADAETATAPMLPDRHHAALFAALRHFEPRFDRLWSDGARREAFLSETPARFRARLAEFLVEVAAYFDVDPLRPPAATLHVFATPAGSGTHAQAIRDHLLIEVRPRETLRHQVAPVVHESAHFLFYRMGSERLARYRALARARGAEGERAWRVLHEALPTAIAQGVAEQRFGRNWSFRHPWYHRDDVDRYAKALYPMVRKALRDEAPLDEAAIEAMLDLFVEAATPRSP